MSSSDPEVVSPDREIVTSRLVAAPRELVWRAWTDPQQILQWWGPTGFTTTTAAMAVRPGGQWRFTMHGPDGRDYENLITYLVVEAPARLVYKHGGDVDLEPVNFTTTVTFEALSPQQTRVTMRAVFASKNARDFVARTYNAVEGGQQTIARLAEHVETLARGGAAPAFAPFVLRRVVRAPRERVFAAWTQRDQLAQWFGPKGSTLVVRDLQLRPGGLFHYAMRFPDGSEWWCRWTWRVVEVPARLVFVATFADAAGAPQRAPFDANWPLATLTTVTFEPHAGVGGGTVVTVHSEPHEASSAEQQRFLDGHASMHGGWNSTFDQLDAWLPRS